MVLDIVVKSVGFALTPLVSESNIKSCAESCLRLTGIIMSSQLLHLLLHFAK